MFFSFLTIYFVGAIYSMLVFYKDSLENGLDIGLYCKYYFSIIKNNSFLAKVVYIVSIIFWPISLIVYLLNI